MSPGPRSPEAKLKRAERTAQPWRDKVRRLELQELEMVQSSLWPSIPEDEHNAAVDCCRAALKSWNFSQRAHVMY
jgi:hypothetical protein